MRSAHKKTAFFTSTSVFTLHPSSHLAHYIMRSQVISGQSLPLPYDVSLDEARLYVEASLYVPELVLDSNSSSNISSSSDVSSKDQLKYKTRVVAYNTYNPRWGEAMQLRYKISGGLDDLCFLRIEVKNQISVSEDITVAHFCASIGSLEKGESFWYITNNMSPDFACYEQVSVIFPFSTNKCRSFFTLHCSFTRKPSQHPNKVGRHCIIQHHVV